MDKNKNNVIYLDIKKKEIVDRLHCLVDDYHTVIDLEVPNPDVEFFVQFFNFMDEVIEDYANQGDKATQKRYRSIVYVYENLISELEEITVLNPDAKYRNLKFTFVEVGIIFECY